MAQPTAIRYPKGYQFFDANGNPLALGTLTYQAAGGSALLDTYSEATGTTPNTNPLVLNGSGRVPSDIYLGSSSAYKETLRAASGATVSPWPADDIPAATGVAGLSTDLDLTRTANNAALNITTGSGVTLGGATTALAGLMSAADKAKVNNLTGVYVACASGVVIKNNVISPGTKIDVTTGPTMMTDDAGNGARSSSATGTIDLSVSGAATGNCLDAGTVGASSWYHVFQITNGSTVAFLASTSATAPTLPSGYTKFVRLGAMPTDGSSVLYRTLQRGRNARYIITGSTNTATFPAFTSNAGSWVAQPVRGVSAPPTAEAVTIRIAPLYSSGQIQIAPNAAYTPGSRANPAAPGAYGNGASYGFIFVNFDTDIVLESDSFYLYGTNTANLAELIGWRDVSNVIS
ncbi:hypothetical protein JDN40_03925 [Rhodomicrobium vannielii ATCC 17100]|uniref:hypothetical protein n=1 Tax=Rhodomicrobium vannielii TaxID=1069 RepID=UPI00191B644B|nr:hypothetical protein [Rhodomicrobium vannielii]MBJ7533254.1 hypothetical protein [Rhodomicrobium vannielii ATCC 17100]